MESSEDKQWATKYLLDPLNAPQPADETGPGTHFVPPPSSTSSKSFHKKSASASTRSVDPPPKQQQTPTGSTTRSSNNPYRNTPSNSTGYPSPPQSTSPHKDRFSQHSTTFPNFDGSYTPTRTSTDRASTQIPTSTGGQDSRSSTTSNGHRRRTSSLNQRYPGDQSHRPLDILRAENKTAHRAPHLRKTHQVGADSVDRLDAQINGAYHHEGPYDATLLARNTNYTSSPIEAVSSTNEEALRATPREMIKDSVEKHRPLDGVASVPPGTQDCYGNSYVYNEGADMMIEGNPEGGAYKRWPGVQYHPDDLKGKGEPSYSIEKALKEHKRDHQRNISEGGRAIEMVRPASRRRPLSVGSGARNAAGAGEERASGRGAERYGEWEAGLNRENSGAAKLRKKFGSMKITGHRSSGSR